MIENSYVLKYYYNNLCANNRWNSLFHVMNVLVAEPLGYHPHISLNWVPSVQSRNADTNIFSVGNAQHGLQFFGGLNVSREYICSKIFILIFLVNKMCFQTTWYKSLVPWYSKTYQIIWSLLYWIGFFTSRCRRRGLRVFQSWA